MKIAIVEDDRRDADILAALIRQYEEKHLTELQLAYYPSGEAFLAASAFETYQLVFMDIYMSGEKRGGQTDGTGGISRIGGHDGMDGIETARRLAASQADSLIVFLTASRDDIWRAVGMHACFDYVEKESLTFERMEKLLDDVRRRLHMQARMLEFYSGKQKVRLSLSKIQYLISHDKYIIFTMEDGGEQRCRVTFSSICVMLEKEKRFLLCNRGIMVNMDYIRKADSESFEMSNGIFLPIRRRSHLEIMKKYNDYQFAKLNEEL